MLFLRSLRSRSRLAGESAVPLALPRGLLFGLLRSWTRPKGIPLFSQCRQLIQQSRLFRFHLLVRFFPEESRVKRIGRAGSMDARSTRNRPLQSVDIVSSESVAVVPGLEFIKPSTDISEGLDRRTNNAKAIWAGQGSLSAAACCRDRGSSGLEVIVLSASDQSDNTGFNKEIQIREQIK